MPTIADYEKSIAMYEKCIQNAQEAIAKLQALPQEPELEDPNEPIILVIEKIFKRTYDCRETESRVYYWSAVKMPYTHRWIVKRIDLNSRTFEMTWPDLLTWADSNSAYYKIWHADDFELLLEKNS